MPTYEYECESCGHTFEKFQYMSEKSLRKCPECSKLKLRRLIGAGAGIIFKGTGFYETDYKRKDEQKKSETTGSDTPKAEAKADTTPEPATKKTESTPAAESKTAKAS